MPKFWGGSKAILRGKFIVIGAYIKKKFSNDLTLYLKYLENE